MIYKNFSSQTILNNNTIRHALKKINSNDSKILFVLNKQKQLVTTITDGDIRRALLNSYSLNDKLYEVFKKKPIYLEYGLEEYLYIEKLKSNEISHLPLVDADKKIIAIYCSNKIINKIHKNIVFILAGGKGKRLKELTKNTPKSLLLLGNKPIIENVIDQFKAQNFYNFIISVNYKKNLIKNYLQNGIKKDISISYVEENKPLGTAGSLFFLKKINPNNPIFVINSDLIFNVNFVSMLKEINEKKVDALIGTKEKSNQISFGVVDTQKNIIKKITEKPIIEHQILSGIYLFKPRVLKEIKKINYLDMPDFLNYLIKKKYILKTFPIKNQWIDIGQINDYQNAKKIFS